MIFTEIVRKSEAFLNSLREESRSTFQIQETLEILASSLIPTIQMSNSDVY